MNGALCGLAAAFFVGFLVTVFIAIFLKPETRTYVVLKENYSFNNDYAILATSKEYADRIEYFNYRPSKDGKKFEMYYTNIHWKR